MHKMILLVGSISGMLSVLIGAFGAHALKTTLEAHNRLETFETAVKYQFYHSIALVLLGILMSQYHSKFFQFSSYGFIIGIIVFSGSLYTLSLTGYNKLGAITPLGGIALIAGWLMMTWGIYKSI